MNTRTRKRKLTTLLIVDVQKAFPAPPHIIKGIRQYAKRFDRRVFTRFINPLGSLFREVLHQESCLPGSCDTDLAIAPQPGDIVIDKFGYGLQPADIRKLRDVGINEVTVCGLDTDACVLGVMFSLFDAEIVCRVREDLCWSSNGLHRPAMKIIEKQFPKPMRKRGQKIRQ